MQKFAPFGSLAVGAALLALGLRLPETALAGAWIALALLLRGWRGLPLRRGVPCLALFLYAGLAVGNRGIIPVRGPLYSVICGVTTIMGVLPFLAERWLGGRRTGWPSTLVFPMAVVARDLLLLHVPHGPATWGALGYTQYGNLPLMQLAAATGIAGLAFLIAWFASTANWAAEQAEWPAARRALLAFAGVVGAVMLGGGLRLALHPAPASTVRAAAISFPRGLFEPREMFRIADGRQPVDATVAPRLARLHEWFFAETEKEARAGARLVAWPEMNFLVPAAEEPAALARAQRLAAQQHVFLAMSVGAVRAGAPRPFRNETVLIGPDGGVLYSYAKSHPVIGWEESVMEPGDGRLPLVDTDLGRLSTAICFEGDIPGYVRQVGRGGADLWILPANDWPEVNRIHFAMAAFRAIENGAPLLRPTSFGTSGAFDAFGRAVGATDHLAGGSSLVADMPVGRVPTLYARVGDLFSWLCVVGLVVAGARSFSRVGSPAAGAPPSSI